MVDIAQITRSEYKGRLITALFSFGKSALMALSMDRHYFATVRKHLGYTQDRFAAVLNVNVYTVKKWEGGSRKIPPEMGYVLAALEQQLKPVGVNNEVPIPHVMGYVFAALQRHLEPIGANRLVEFGGKDSDSE